MRMRTFLVALTFAFAGMVSHASASDAPVETAAPAAAPPATTTPPPAAKPVSDEDRMICKAERTVGSNRVQRVCRSAAQVQREREAARSELGKAQLGGG